jgi:hypothetical protein
MASLHLNITPQPNVMRAREPVTPPRGVVRGQFPSTKMKRMIAWKSQLEQKACYHFEYSPAIVAFREQPETLYFPYQEGMCCYTPDFQLTLYNGEIIYVEIRPLAKLRSPAILERLQLANQFLADKGYHFFVITDAELNFPNRIRNFTILRPNLRVEVPSYISQQALTWLAHTSDPSFGVNRRAILSRLEVESIARRLTCSSMRAISSVRMSCCNFGVSLSPNWRSISGNKR